MGSEMCIRDRSNASRLERGLNDPIGSLFNGICRTNQRASRIVTVHTDNGSCLNRVGTLYLFQVDHRDPRMGIAFAARLKTSITSDASAWVDIELALAHLV